MQIAGEGNSRGPLFREEVVERLDGFEFVVADIEDGVELGDVEHVVHFLREVEQLEFASGVANGYEAAHKLADTGTVDVVDTGQVENDFLFVLTEEVADGAAQRVQLVAEDNAPVEVEDRDVIDLAFADVQAHIPSEVRTALGSLGRTPQEW
jgi:hypothetical protein